MSMTTTAVRDLGYGTEKCLPSPEAFDLIKVNDFVL